jgi:hypothetical protein
LLVYVAPAVLMCIWLLEFMSGTTYISACKGSLMSTRDLYFRVGSQFFSGYFRESVPIVAQSRSLPLLSEVGFPPVLGLKAGRRVNGRFLPPRPSTSLASRYLTASAARSTARAVLNHPPLSFISHSLPCLSALTECDDPWRHLQAQLGSSNVCSSPMFLPNSWLQIYLIY